MPPLSKDEIIHTLTSTAVDNLPLFLKSLTVYQGGALQTHIQGAEFERPWIKLTYDILKESCHVEQGETSQW
jgi:hypothetical protein